MPAPVHARRHDSARPACEDEASSGRSGGLQAVRLLRCCQRLTCGDRRFSRVQSHPGHWIPQRRCACSVTHAVRPPGRHAPRAVRWPPQTTPVVAQRQNAEDLPGKQQDPRCWDGLMASLRFRSRITALAGRRLFLRAINQNGGEGHVPVAMTSFSGRRPQDPYDDVGTNTGVGHAEPSAHELRIAHRASNSTQTHRRRPPMAR